MGVGSFLWGSGGRRLTPEEIARERQQAAQRMRTDYSPIQSPWQGLARVADNLMGAIASRRADRASTRNAEDQRRIIEALMGGGGSSVAPSAPLDAGPAGMGQVSSVVAGLTDNPQPSTPLPAPPASPGVPAINPALMEAMTSPFVSAEVRAAAMAQYRAQLQAANRAPRRPHYWETNNGSLGMVGTDGQPRILYNDPTPRTDYIMVTDPATGQRRFVQVPRAIAPQATAPPTNDPTYWTPVEEGGPQASSSADDFRGGAPVARAAPVRPHNLASPSSVQATWTSGRRTAEGNEAVGGVPNSAHLRGDAADFTPRGGETMAQLARSLRSRFPGARVVNEGDHVHVQQRGWNVPYHGRRGIAGLGGGR